MTIPKRQVTKATDYRNTKVKRARFFGLILRSIVLIGALYAFVVLFKGLLYGGKWGVAALAFVLASGTLMAMIPKPPTVPVIEAEGTLKPMQRWSPDWSLICYCVVTGLGYNWVCVFLWFSRRYSFFSTPVVGATGLTMALYAAIALLVARLTEGNWRTVLLVFALVPCVLAGIVLRLALLR